MGYATKADYRAAWARSYTEDPPVPLNLDLELAATCNAKCPFCLYGDRDWFKDMAEMDWDGKAKKRLMPTETAISLLDEGAAIGIPAVKLNFRGESLLHKDFRRIAEHAKALGYWDVLSNTNGNIQARLFEDGIAGLMACTKVMVSLDSMDPATYPKVRVGLSLDSAQRTITELVKRGHPDLWVRRVKCKSNAGEDFAGAVYREWPTGVKVSEHAVFDRNHYSEEEMTGEDHTKWERTFCGYSSQRLVVEASGRYQPCCLAWSGEFDAGSWPNISLREYWDSEWRRTLSNELRQNIFTNAKCKSCTSYMSFKRPERATVQDVEVVRE